MQSFVALEWLGTKIPPRAVVVKLKPKCVVEVVSSRGTRLRTLGLGHSSDVEIYQSSNKGRTTLMIKIPKEYDLVSIFSIASEQSYIILFAMLFTHKHSRCNQNIENNFYYCKIISRSISLYFYFIKIRCKITLLIHLTHHAKLFFHSYMQ